MGFIRGAGLVIALVLFFISLLVGNTLLTISSSLDYENIKPELENIIQQIIQENINLTENSKEFEMMQKFCLNNSESFEFSEEEFNFNISCETIIQGPEAIIANQINQKIEEIYYQEYDCNFWDCRNENELPYYLVSEKAHEYWKHKHNQIITISIILFFIILLLAQSRSNAFITTGILTIIAAIPFLKLEWLFQKIAGDGFLSFFTSFFSQSMHVFYKSLIMGIILLIIGIIWKFFHLGFYLKSLFDKAKCISKTGEVKECLTKPIPTQPKEVLKENVKPKTSTKKK